MKILYLTPGCFDKGGISRYSRYQISALREIYDSNSVFVLSLLGKEPSSFEDEFEVSWSAKGNSLFHQVKFALVSIYFTLKYRPDVIHIAHVNFSGLAWLLRHISGATTILNTYGLEVWSGLKPHNLFALKNISKVISDCHFTARYLEDTGLQPKGSIKVIWDCVDLKRFCPGERSPEICSKYGIPDPNRFVNILTLGRISRVAAHKGYDRLLNAFADVAVQCPNARLIIAGGGDLVDDLKQLAIELDVAEKVIFTGLIDESDLADIYRISQIFSLISDRGNGRGEGIPLTPLEAMACGVPILVGNQDGSQEAVVEGENGYILDPFDQTAHALRLIHLIQDTELCKNMADSAISVAHAKFSYEHFVIKHRELFSEMFSFKHNG